ncbi:MAG: hypothetical protein QXY05_01080 [Candidatus Anstonellales archaeon]
MPVSFRKELYEEHRPEKTKNEFKNEERITEGLSVATIASYAEKVLSDVQYTGILARVVGKDFEKRMVDRKDFEKFVSIYNIDPKRTEARTIMKLIPIYKKGYQWHSIHSKRLRKKYMEKAKLLFNIAERVDINSLLMSEGIEIYGRDVVKSEERGTEFNNAYAIVEKKPRKKRMSRSSVSLLFQEMYFKRQRIVAFGIFDGIKEGNAREHEISSFALDIFKSYVELFGEKPEESNGLGLLESFAKEADARISEKFDGGCEALAGFVLGDRAVVLKVGNQRLYGISGFSRCFTTDDGISGLVELGEKIAKNEFLKEMGIPFAYLGGFSQKINGKDVMKVLHREFKLGKTNLFSLDLSGFDMLVAVNKGVWMNAPFKEEEGKIVDAYSEKWFFELSNGDCRKTAQNIARAAKKNMNVYEEKGGFIVKGSAQDVGVLAFAV